MARTWVLIVTTLVFVSTAWGQTPQPLLCDLSRVLHKPGEVTTKDNKKVPTGSVDLIDGQFGKACKFTLVESTTPQFFTAWVNPKDDYDQFDGFSFWVKGDGSKNCGGLELIDGDDFGLRYGYCFPIQSKDWVKVNVPWGDVIPELAGPPVDAKQGYDPNRFRNLWVGKWFYWRDYPACSFTIERMALEKHIDRDTTDYRPKEPGVPRLLAKLKAGRPVTIVTMGDSLTDKRHWANREQLWAEELVAQLTKAYHSEVSWVNPAIGGTTLSQNVILMPRWLQEAPSPDLVLIWFGGNDWDTSVRGPRYRQYLEMAIDRVRRATKGQAEVLVMTTCPGFAAWETRNELCRAAFEVAREGKTGFVDAAGAFLKAGSREEALKRKYWAWDNVHLGPGGHKLIADTVFRAIGSGGAGDLAASAGASWMKSTVVAPLAGDWTPLSSFEPNQDDLVDHGAGQVVKEHASDGDYSLRLVSKQNDYPGLSLQDGRVLRLLHENSRVLVDVYNPQGKDVDVQLIVRDPHATNFNLRYNGSVTVKPGMNTIDIDYTKLPRYATQKSDKPEYLNARELTLFGFFLDQGQSSKPLTLFFDNVRLARQPTGQIESRPVKISAPPPKPARKAGVRPGVVELLSSFEPGGPDLVRGDGVVVAQHATDGRFALQVQSDGKSYRGLQITEGRALRKFKDYILLKIDVFNPQDEPVHCGARIDDAASKDYGSRYNDDGVAIPPGKSTFEINLTGLTKSNARNFADRKKIDLATVRLMTLCIAPEGKPLTLFFDNVRLEGSGLPVVEGLKAFGFGPPGAAVYPGFEGCTQQVAYNDDRGYGWIGGEYATIAYMPDALTGNCATGRAFHLKLPNGRYEVHLCWDMFGLWGTLPTFHWRKLLVNGQEVLNERRSGAEFLANQYYAHEDDEDLPGQDLWEKYIASYQKIHRFAATVTDGLLRIEPQADGPLGRGICFLVVYPRDQLAAGRNFMDTLTARRKAQFNAGLVVSVPKASGAQPAAREEDLARGFIAFVAHTEDDVAVNARPPQDIGLKPLVIAAAQGERQAAQVGLYPLEKLVGVKVTVDDLVGASTGTDPRPQIPASAVQVRKVRSFLKGEGQGRVGRLLPYIVQEFQTLDLQPGVTRALWLTITIPRSALPGTYRGALRIVAGNKSTAIPINLSVYPFTLDKVTDLTISVTGSTPGTFAASYPELQDRWWQIAEQVMKDQAEHGMNAVTGGPGALLRGVAGGKADIDYTQIDRWMALAVKYGLTMPGDSYQGLDVAGLPTDQGPDCVARCEAAARQKFGVSYAELLRIVYGDLERHALQQGWPKRVYYFLDEPRREYSNVEPCAKLIKIRTAASPGTLFSGYYSTGDGRDVYFENMPVSIAHVDKLSLQLVAKGGRRIWDYSGDRVRHDIGRWAFVAGKAGMKGFLRNGYMYVCSQPYFDFSDDEPSWSVVYPSTHGLNGTVGWERTAQGVNDYRYLLTCMRLVEEARRMGKDAPVADAAHAFLQRTLRPIAIDDKESARLSPRQYDEFRSDLAGHIVALNRACAP